MPLLGVHEVVFAPVTEEQAQGALRLAKLSFEIFLSSFQVPKRGAGATPFEFRPSYSERIEGSSHPLVQPRMGCEDGIFFIHSTLLS